MAGALYREFMRKSIIIRVLRPVCTSYDGFLWVFPRKVVRIRMNSRNSLYNAPAKKVSNLNFWGGGVNFRPLFGAFFDIIYFQVDVRILFEISSSLPRLNCWILGLHCHVHIYNFLWTVINH